MMQDEKKIIVSKFILLATTLVAFSPVKALAGAQSILDPYATVQAPNAASKQKTKPVAVKAAKPPKAAKQPKETKSEDSPLVSESKEERSRPLKPLKIKEHKDKPIASAPSSQDGIMSGLKDIGQGYAKTFKAAGTAMASGAKVIGQGLQAIVSKLKDGVGSAGSKIAEAPNIFGKHKKDNSNKDSSDLQPKADQIASSKKGKEDFPGKPLEAVSDKPIGKPAPGLISHTLGKFNFFGHGGNDKALPPPAAISDLHPQVTN